MIHLVVDVRACVRASVRVRVREGVDHMCVDWSVWYTNHHLPSTAFDRSENAI